MITHSSHKITKTKNVLESKNFSIIPLAKKSLKPRSKEYYGTIAASNARSFEFIERLLINVQNFSFEIFIRLAVFVSLIFLTNCVGVGVFHKSEEKIKGSTLEYEEHKCPRPVDYKCFRPAITLKKDLIKKRGNPQSVEIINENEEKLVYRKGFGWSGINLMLGIPIPIGVPTYMQYEYLYFRDGVLFKFEEDASELYGVWYGFNGGILNDKTHKVEWFGYVVKLK